MDQRNSSRNSIENIQVLHKGFSPTISKILPSAESKNSPILKLPLLQLKLPDLFLSNPPLKDESEPNQRMWYFTLNPSSFPSFSTKPKITNSANTVLTIRYNASGCLRMELELPRSFQLERHLKSEKSR